MAIYNTIDKFRAHVKAIGLPTASHFNIILPGIIGFTTDDRGVYKATTSSRLILADTNVVNMLCDSVTIPGINIMTDELRLVGEVSDIPYMISYPPINLSFIEDNNFSVRNYFEKWTNFVYDRETRQSGYFDDVTAEVQIMVSDRAGNIRYCIKLHKAFPKMLNDQSYNFSSHDIVKTDVQFSYKYWEKIEMSSTGESRENKISELNRKIASDPLGSFIQNLPGTLSTTSSGYNFGNDVGSDLSVWGPKMGSEFIRSGNSANSVISTSGINGGSQMGTVFSDLGGSMGTFGQTMGELGRSLASIGSVAGKVGTAVAGVSGTVGAVNQVLSGLGINTGLSKVAADIAQVGGKLGVLSQIGGLPGNLGSLGANMGAVGSEIKQAVGAIGDLPGATNQVKSVISNLGSLFSNKGSELTQSSSAIQAGIDSGKL